MLNIKVIQNLANIRGDNLVSIYLNTNRQKLSSLVIRTKAKDLFKEAELSREEKKEIEKKVIGFLSHISLNTKSVAIFTSKNFWSPFVFPFEIEDNFLSVDSFFNIEPLLLILRENKNIGVFLVDSERARFLSVFLGDLKDHRSLEDHVIEKQAQGGWSKERFARRREEMIKHHLKKAASLLIGMDKVYNFDYLFIRSDPEIEHEFIGILPENIKKKIKGDIKVDIREEAGEIIEKALVLAKTEVKKEEKGLVQKISELLETEAGRVRAVAELDNVLQAFYDQRVRMILVNEGLSLPGFYCMFCGHIARSGEFCPYDQTPNSRVENIIDVLIDNAVKQKVDVEVFKNDKDLKRLGNIAAFLKEH